MLTAVVQPAAVVVGCRRMEELSTIIIIWGLIGRIVIVGLAAGKASRCFCCLLSSDLPGMIPSQLRVLFVSFLACNQTVLCQSFGDSLWWTCHLWLGVCKTEIYNIMHSVQQQQQQQQ